MIAVRGASVSAETGDVKKGGANEFAEKNHVTSAAEWNCRIALMSSED